jgi:hypothetical protein
MGMVLYADIVKVMRPDMDEPFYGGLNRSDAKSLALYQAIRQKLESSSDRILLIQNALTWVRKFKPSMPEVPYLREWEERLQTALQSEDARRDLLNWMTSTDEHTITMRSCSPFSQVLTTKERTDALVRFAHEYPDNVPKIEGAGHAG